MYSYNDNFSMQTAIELAKLNISSSSSWTKPEEVIDFIEKVYTALNTGSANSYSNSDE